jgi:hypothetical protein
VILCVYRWVTQEGYSHLYISPKPFTYDYYFTSKFSLCGTDYVNYRFFDMNYRLLGYAGSPTPCYNVMSLRENQATAKQAFGFLGSLTSKYPAKQDE